MNVYLVRHAQSFPCSSLSDREWGLSPLGLQQAQALVPVLRGLVITEIHSSPYLRCYSTIEPYISSKGVPLTYNDSLRERKIAEGIIDNFDEVWTQSWEDFEYKLPNCESSAIAQWRIYTAVLDICLNSHHESIAVCSHGNVIGLLINALDVSFGATEAISLRNPDILCLRYTQGTLIWNKSFKTALALDDFATPHSATVFHDASA